MPSVIIYRHTETPAQVIQLLISVDPTSYQERPDAKIYTDTSTPTETEVQLLVAANPYKHLKVVGDAVEVMTQSERNQVDADETAAALANAKQSATNAIDGLAGYQLRALVSVLLAEINALRERDRDRSVDVAAATNLANLQTRWAARSALNDRTLAQAKTAYKNALEGSGLDE